MTNNTATPINHGTELQEEYESRAKHIADLITQFQAKLETHKTRFDADNKNWGYAGDLGHFKQLLDELVR